MVMLTLQVNSDDAMETIRNLENRHLVEVLENSVIDSPSLPGKAMRVKAFKSWVADAEKSTTVSLTDAKEKWAHKRRQLEQHTL
jgi:fructose-specific component phosphotransferase system IIB-like protein